jgi:hypothetical protein
MDFKKRSDLHGKHALLSPSQYHWVNYTDQKLEARFYSAMSAAKGTRLHNFAQDAIELGIKMPKTKTTLNMYINDGIGYKMECEQPLYYSPNCFGHADAISFRNGVLRIHDLKNGISPASFTQLMIYAALFCLEYSIDPGDIQILLRIYQNDEIKEHEPFTDEILDIMDKIVYFDQQIEILKERGEW